MKLPEPIAKLVQEVFAKYGEEDAVGSREDAGAYLVSLLLTIKEELPEVSAMLDSTVEKATFESNLKEARQYLQKAAARTKAEAKAK